MSSHPSSQNTVQCEQSQNSSLLWNVSQIALVWESVYHLFTWWVIISAYRMNQPITHIVKGTNLWKFNSFPYTVDENVLYSYIRGHSQRWWASDFYVMYFYMYSAIAARSSKHMLDRVYTKCDTKSESSSKPHIFYDEKEKKKRKKEERKKKRKSSNFSRLDLPMYIRRVIINTEYWDIIVCSLLQHLINVVW